MADEPEIIGFLAARQQADERIAKGRAWRDRLLRVWGRDVEERPGFTLYSGFVMSGGDGYDDTVILRLRPVAPPTFFEMEAWGDGPYRFVYVSEDLLTVVCYVEGDIQTEVFREPLIFRRRLDHLHRFYGRREYDLEWTEEDART